MYRSRQSEKLRAGPEREKSPDIGKVKSFKKGETYIKHIDATKIRECKGLFSLTYDYSLLTEMDCIMICVPTPLSKNREAIPEFVFDTTLTITRYLRKGEPIALILRPTLELQIRA